MNALVLLLACLCHPLAAVPDVPPPDAAAAQPAQPAAPPALPPWLTSQDAIAPGDADFGTAIAAYRSGDYAQALALFAALADAEPDAARAAVLHADAGTAAARADRLGEAVWHLRTARALLPRDAITSTNLDRVRVLLGEGESEASHFTSTLRELPLRLTLHESASVCSVAVLVSLLLLALWRARRLSRLGLLASLALLVLAGAWYGVSCREWSRLARQAVVIDSTVNGRAEPDEMSQILFRLPGGSVVSAEEERHDWRLVESAAGARGWMPALPVRPLGVRN